MILENLPALLIAVPLFGAFLAPILGHFLPKTLHPWVILFSLLSSITGIATAVTVFTKGTIIYVFGAGNVAGSAVVDSLG
ncbi:MAG: NADH:ubiquinone oxidoreductase, partial [Methanocorpusculum sp.]|nr:NADH:ubiquinone oxidoreductase [Methanocorpusculum sp.]